ncbi:MAG: hypothetical protein NTW21_42205 [Verrucomicrobia bacterium]|nr:hypothetical protein [Verrucomicrobiota bacterium]
MKPLITTIGTLAIATSVALAQDKPSAPGTPQPPQPENFFRKLDSNSDGTLRLDEYAYALLHSKTQPGASDPLNAAPWLPPGLLGPVKKYTLQNLHVSMESIW